MAAVVMWRGWQFDQLRRTLDIMKSIMDTHAIDSMQLLRDGGEGWTVLEVLCHLRDFEALFLERAHMTVEQDFPDLPFPDPDELAEEKQYIQQDIQVVYQDWVAHRHDFITFLESVDETAWEKQAKHPKRGPFSLHDQLFLTVWHDNLHLEQITRILAEKRA